jgi:hypothetical protein
MRAIAFAQTTPDGEPLTVGHHGLARAVAVFALSLVVDVIRALRRLKKVGTPAFYRL